MIKFEWDSTKAAGNEKKHGISFEEAKSVFYDEFAVQFYDNAHSGEEHRFLMVGYFKEMAESSGVPYQSLINLYLQDCVRKHRTIDISWLSNSAAVSSQ